MLKNAVIWLLVLALFGLCAAQGVFHARAFSLPEAAWQERGGPEGSGA